MAFEREGEHLRALDAQIHAAIFDRGNRRLGDSRESGKLTLAQRLQFAQNAHGLTYRDLDSFFRRARCFHVFSNDFLIGGNGIK